ncbi:MAG: hypothetical protein GY823_05935 [Flavobacteriaceae bacterium]|nr:hypothetical protein [Flavobacteriaceae bacterium]
MSASPYFFDNVIKGPVDLPPAKYVITRGICEPISGHAFYSLKDKDLIYDSIFSCYLKNDCNLNPTKADLKDLISICRTAKSALQRHNCYFGEKKLDILVKERAFTEDCFVSADFACQNGFPKDDFGITDWEKNGEKCRGYTSCRGQSFDTVCRAVPPYRYHWECERDALRPCFGRDSNYTVACNNWDNLKSDNNITDNPNIIYVTVITKAAGINNKNDLTPAILLFNLTCQSIISTGLAALRQTSIYNNNDSFALDSKIESAVGPLQNGQVDTSKCFSFQIDIRDPIESLFCFLPKTSDICKDDPVTRAKINTCFPAGESGQSQYLDTCTSFLANLDANNKPQKETAFTLMSSYYPNLIANRCTFPDDDPAYQEMEGLASFANQPYSCWWRYCQNSNNTIFIKDVNRKISEKCNVCICINSIDLENIDRSILGDFTQICSVECGGPDPKDGDGGDGGDNGDNGDDNDEEEDNTTSIGGGTKNISNTNEFFSLLKENTPVLVILVIIVILIIVGIISFAFTYRNPDSLKQLEVTNEKIKPTPVKSDASKVFKRDNEKIKTDRTKDNSKKKASNNSKKKDLSETKTLIIIRNVAIAITAISLITALYVSYSEIVLDKPIISNRSFTSIEPPIKLDGNKVDEFNSFVKKNQLFTAINTAYFYENDDVEFYLKRKIDLDDMNKLLDKLRKIFPNKKLVISAVNLVAESNQPSFFKQKVTVHKPGINGLYKPAEIKGQDIISNKVLVTQYQKSVYN